ncbi:alpha/beta fold hydrolase [uncultured Gemella sp.]|uniref:alpha/beta fold hydrolase n=1 Tax=uncultured Gemella sp. TaxID=254352 RepID=UPI0028D25E42|nr:alpha/beta fold hydrolase [uncultured Gemella sp.]
MDKTLEFKNFWDEKIKYIDTIQLCYKLEKTSFSKFENIEFYNLTFTSFDNSTIYAKYIKNLKYRTLYPNKAIPMLFYFHGYPASSRNWLEKSTFSSLGYDVVAIDFRNQGGLSKDKSNSSPSVFGHLTIGLDENIEDMIFFKNILDTLILSRIVTSFDDIDSQNIASYGASQGGAFSIMFTALNKNVTKCISLYPFLSDFQTFYENDNRKNAYAEFTHHGRWFNTKGENTKAFLNNLYYLDTLNFAKLLKCNILFGISNLDEDCPKETQEKVFNNIKSKKKAYIYKKYYHENIPHFNDEIFNFLLEEK